MCSSRCLWIGPRYAFSLGRQWQWPLWPNLIATFLGGGLIVAGAGVFLYCTGLFTYRGHGTPVPAVPPSRLVSTGLYRRTRNPIYLAYVAILIGEALFVGSTSVVVYAIAIFLFFHLMVIAHEEPQLRRRFGSEYSRYQKSVPRWLKFRSSGSPEF